MGIENDAWHEDDHFWEALEDVLFQGFTNDDAAVTEVDRVVDLLGLEREMNVLDLGCGTGRHSLLLARRGLRVTGIDRTRVYVEKARSRAVEDGLEAELLVEDIRDFRRPQAFDAAISLFSSFGYFSDLDDERRALDGFYTSLKPGGRLLMDLNGKEVMARRFQERFWMPHPDGQRFLLEERKIRPGWCWADIRWSLVGGSEPLVFDWSIRLYSAGEIEMLLHRAGFGDVECFGSLERDPYGLDAKRLVVLARKSGP